MTTLFEKRGRRYYPVHETVALDGLRLGSWVVTVMRRDGGTLTTLRETVKPDHAAVIASIAHAREAMEHAMHEANSVTRPANRPMSPKQKRAFRAYQAVMAEDKDVPLAFEGICMRDVVAAGVTALEKEMGVEK
jgi:hypothetical protein